MTTKGVVAVGLTSLQSALALPFLTQGAFIHRALSWSQATSNAANDEQAHSFGFRFRLPGSPSLFSYRYDSLTRQWSSGD